MTYAWLALTALFCLNAHAQLDYDQNGRVWPAPMVNLRTRVVLANLVDRPIEGADALSAFLTVVRPGFYRVRDAATAKKPIGTLAVFVRASGTYEEPEFRFEIRGSEQHLPTDPVGAFLVPRPGGEEFAGMGLTSRFTATVSADRDVMIMRLRIDFAHEHAVELVTRIGRHSGEMSDLFIRGLLPSRPGYPPAGAPIHASYAFLKQTADTFLTADCDSLLRKLGTPRSR